MKYSGNNPPIACMQTKSACYRGPRQMTVRGVLWHSTGADNPSLARYIQPADDDPGRAALLALLGANQYGNDYNHGSRARQMGVNAWIGRLADGTVAAVQAMPWDYQPWGCGAGDRGSCNDGWIQFEICEDGLRDEGYAMAAYSEACELTAYLCRMFSIDPTGTVRFRGVDVPTILDHAASHALGLGSNHGDIKHWFPKFGKNLETIRKDVKALMGGPTGTGALPTLRQGDRGEYVARMQEDLISHGYSLAECGGADGIFGGGTRKRVTEFQASRGLAADGVVGPKTWAALENELGETYTVTIPGLSKLEAESIRLAWPQAEVSRG